MARPWTSAVSIFSLLLFCFDGAAADHYVRPPPRSIIKTQKTRGDSHPEQVHVSLAGADHMRITWLTADKHAPSIVDYGKSSGDYSASATGERTSYRYYFYTSGTIHHVTIGPLQPDTLYYYRCSGAASEFTLKTPPSSLPIDLAVAGDLGQTEWTSSTLSHINSSDYDLLLLPGDLSYADAQQPLWDSFGRFVEPLASSRPWMVTEGNHEVESFVIFDFNFHPFASYNARWRMPYRESGSPSNLYYSFDVAGGAVHVVMLGSYAAFGDGSEQYRWLVGDLAAVDRSRTPWVVVVVHAPWYNTNAAHQGEGEAMREAMEELLYGSRVDLVFAGHVHAYERFTRIYNNKADPCGPMYITIGDGGNREGLAMDFEKKHKSFPLSLFREASFGHGRLRISNQTHAQWSWHRNNDASSIVRDEVWLESLSASNVCNSVKGMTQPSLVNDEL